MDFGGSSSAEKLPPSPWFSPPTGYFLPAEFWFEIHVHQHYFLEKNANWHRVIQQGS